MPIYEYICQTCDSEFEKIVFGSSPHIECPKCNGVNVAKRPSICGIKTTRSDSGSSPSSSCGSCSSSNCSSCGN
ncbi:zinc ribbon domain-containing protein [Thermodesulfobacteriota bacterium]